MMKESVIEMPGERALVSLRVHLSSGRTQEITHLENAIVAGRELIRHIPPSQVNEVEPITSSRCRLGTVTARSLISVVSGLSFS